MPEPKRHISLTANIAGEDLFTVWHLDDLEGPVDEGDAEAWLATAVAYMLAEVRRAKDKAE